MAKLLNTLGPDSGAGLFKENIDVILFNELVGPRPGETAGITESPSMKLLRELRPKLLSHCLSLTPAAAASCRVFRHGDAGGIFLAGFLVKIKGKK
jgi:hypothetical protein